MDVALGIADARDYRFLVPYGVRLADLDAALWRALGSRQHERAAILLRAAGPAAAGALRPLAASLGDEAGMRALGVLAEWGPAAGPALQALRACSPGVAAAAGEALAQLDGANPYALSGREREVLRLLADGLRTKDIAERLVLTPATVSTHIQRIMNKTGTSSRAQLLALAAREDPRPVK